MHKSLSKSVVTVSLTVLTFASALVLDPARAYAYSSWSGQNGDYVSAYASQAWAVADEILYKIIKPDMNDEKKVKAVYDFLIYNAVHRDDTQNPNAKQLEFNRQPDHSAYTPKHGTGEIGSTYSYFLSLMEIGSGVCDHFAASFSTLVGRMGIPVETWGGVYVNRDGTRRPHAFNRAQINGKWYWYDVDVEGTVYRRGGKVLYFLYKQASFDSNHADMSVIYDWNTLNASFTACPVPFSLASVPAQEKPAANQKVNYSLSPDISVIYNGNKIAFNEPVILSKDYLCIQTRPLLEAMGITSEFKSENGKQYIDAVRARDGLTVRFIVNDPSIYTVQGGSASKTKTYDSQFAQPLVANDRFYVPVMYITDAFGATREWNSNSQTVNITD